MIAEPDIPNSKKPVIPDSDRESSDIACELIPAFAGMTNVGNECIDAVGNVLAIYNANSSGRGNELYYFTQDAFGNELTTSPFSGTVWSTARAAGITEHQTGKWIDPFTGLYYFHARWYDSTVGRFVGRDTHPGIPIEYIYALSSPTIHADFTGYCNSDIHYDYTYVWSLLALSSTSCEDCWADVIASANKSADLTINFNVGHCFGFNKVENGIKVPDETRIELEFQRMLDESIGFCCDPDKVGKALHFRQDCFVHSIFDPPWGHLGISGIDEKCVGEYYNAIEVVTLNAVSKWVDNCCNKY